MKQLERSKFLDLVAEYIGHSTSQNKTIVSRKKMDLLLIP